MSKGLFYNFAVVDSGSAIDAEAGTILGVAVITAGPARGHSDWESGKPLYADATTLREVMQCAQTYAGGLKVKFNHGSGVGDIVGRLENFRIDGDVLRADFRALSASPHRAYLFEIASTIPESFGLSVSFSGKPTASGERAFARCSEIYSADFVDEPAANPTGLFQRGAGNPAEAAQSQLKSNLQMEDEKKDDPIAAMSAALEAISARLSALEAVGEKEEAMADEDEEKKEEMQAKRDERIAMAALKAFAAQFGTPAAPVSHEAKREDKQPVKTFEAVVAEKAVELKSKAAAIKSVAVSHPELHQAYLARVRAGEVITL
jgi:hypothetical protein